MNLKKQIQQAYSEDIEKEYSKNLGVPPVSSIVYQIANTFRLLENLLPNNLVDPCLRRRDTHCDYIEYSSPVARIIFQVSFPFPTLMVRITASAETLMQIGLEAFGDSFTVEATAKVTITQTLWLGGVTALPKTLTDLLVKHFSKSNPQPVLMEKLRQELEAQHLEDRRLLEVAGEVLRDLYSRMCHWIEIPDSNFLPEEGRLFLRWDRNEFSAELEFIGFHWIYRITEALGDKTRREIEGIFNPKEAIPPVLWEFLENHFPEGGN